MSHDLPGIPRNLVRRIVRAIERRLMRDPAGYGKKLSQSLRALWKIRVGDYRVVYQITGATVTVRTIQHRGEVYQEAQHRWRRSGAAH